MTQMNELGFYTLAGAPESPRELIDEVRQAEELGIGNVFISERFNIKEAATLSGAVGVAAESMGIATAATNHHTRHPVVGAVKQSAEESGRDPDSVKVWSCFATIGDHLPEDVRLKKTVGRMATYLQGYPELMARTNNWDQAALERFLADDLVANFQGTIDQVATTEQLEHIAELIPDEWLAPAATGTPAQCVEKIRGQFDLGCDGVILHGASPTQLRPIVEEYARTRPTGTFDHLPANPGG